MANNSFKKALRNPQNIIALGVTLISVCALIVSILQTRIMSEQRALMHEQAAAAVWPRLGLDVYKAHQPDRSIGDYFLMLGNDGVGPAIISGVRVSYAGEVVQHWWDLFDKFNLPDSVNMLISNATMNQEIVKIGEEYKVLDLKTNLPLAQQYYEHADQIKIEILYESIYGDKWLFTHTQQNVGTERVAKDFVIPEEEQFEN